MNATLNLSRLRADLQDYYGTAMTTGFPMAVMELSEVEHATDSEIIELARDAGFDLNDYIED